MSSNRVSKRSSTLQRKSLADKIREFGLPAMVAYSGCICVNVLCVFGKESLSCAYCVSLGHKCDSNFSEKDFDIISAKKNQLSAALCAQKEKRCQTVFELQQIDNIR